MEKCSKTGSSFRRRVRRVCDITSQWGQVLSCSCRSILWESFPFLTLPSVQRRILGGLASADHDEGHQKGRVGRFAHDFALLRLSTIL